MAYAEKTSVSVSKTKADIEEVGGGRTYGKSCLMALYARKKVADDMYKSSKNDKEKEFYKHELENIRAEISNMTVCD